MVTRLLVSTGTAETRMHFLTENQSTAEFPRGPHSIDSKIPLSNIPVSQHLPVAKTTQKLGTGWGLLSKIIITTSVDHYDKTFFIH